MAMKYEKAAINTMIEDFGIVFAFLADIFYFHEPITFTKILGTILIVGACLKITLSK